MTKSLFDPDPLTAPFDDAPAQRHSPTSVAAAEQVKPIAETQRRLVLSILQMAGERGLTDDEIQAATGMNPSGARPRRIELVRAGLVRDSGRTRKTRSGREAVVWTAVKEKE